MLFFFVLSCFFNILMYNNRGSDFIMLNKYYDKWEFDQAFDLSETNPIESKRRYEAYLEKSQ